jgi:predicted RNA-binding protein with EMAP domain
MYNDRKLALLNEWKEATKSGKIDKLYTVYIDIKQFASEVITDTTTPDETKEQVNALLDIMENYIKEKNYTFTT